MAAETPAGGQGPHCRVGRRSFWRLSPASLLGALEPRLQLMLLGGLVGVCGGVAAVALNLALHAGVRTVSGLREDAWLALAMPAAGAALSVVFLSKVVRETPGHGVPDVIYSVSRRAGLMRFRSSFSRLVSSFLTIAAGGSAGPEAPVVCSGAALGSNVAKLSQLSDRMRVTLLACGAAGALGSIFNAPITGIVFALEVLLGEWAQVNIMAIGIASVAGTHVGRLLLGGQIPFEHQLFSPSLLDTLATVGLALLCVAVSVLFSRLLVGVERAAHRIVPTRWLLAAAGGAMVGAIGWWMPEVLGEGYHVTRALIAGEFAAGITVVALLVGLKTLCTCLTLGTGGSGGIFAPSLLIGSATGVLYRRGLALALPALPFAAEGCYALLGMAGLLSGALQAPLTAMFLIVEITGSWEVILPLIVVSAVAAAVCRYVEPASLYTRELLQRGDLVRPRTDARILEDLSLAELIETDCVAVSPQMRLGELVDIIKSSHRNYFPVVDSQTERFVGMVHLDDVRRYIFDPTLYDIVLISNIMDTTVDRIGPDEPMPKVLERLEQTGSWSLPVVEGDRFVGLISKGTLLDHYRRELMVQSEA